MSQIFEKETQDIMKYAGFFREDGSIDNENIKTAWNRVPKEKQPKILQELLSTTFGSPTMTPTLKDDNSVVLHSQSSGKDGTVPVTLDTFAHIREMFGELGIANPQVFMSEETTENMRTALKKLPVSEEQKNEFRTQF